MTALLLKGLKRGFKKNAHAPHICKDIKYFTLFKLLA
jgi:hypothetical protein